jgi:hypothetical protein
MYELFMMAILEIYQAYDRGFQREDKDSNLTKC